MKHVFFLFFFFASVISLKAQVSETTAIRLYRVNDHLVRAEGDGSNPVSYSYGNVNVRAINDLIEVSIVSGSTSYYLPSLFLNDQGIPYGTTVSSAINAYLLNLPATSGTGSSETAVTTNASSLTSGTLDDARLSENVVKTTGSYTNPAWISALDPTRITQNSLHRFVSEAEKEAWNQKPDLAQVKLAIKDSTRTYTFVNAAVTSSGTSTTVTIPSGGGTSMPVDTVLNTASPNAIANAAVAKAINQTNANVATNSANIATNAASLSALQTQLTAVTAITAVQTGPIDDARLSENVVKTTGSYTNPAWISALDPTRITQNSLHRFVSEAEKEAWNQKPDLAQVKLAIKDSTRTYTFVNAAVTSSGTSTTVTIPSGGGASMPVDTVLSATSPNAIANAAVAKAINQTNANVATNTAAISQANANIATNAASLSALQTQLTAVTAITAVQTGPIDDARLSENVVKTTGSYTNPAWISALDPTRITQNSLHRFVSEAEKEAWNQKPDLAQVKLAIKDSTRTYTFVNAAVTSSGTSTTVTIPSGGGTSMPVDTVLSATSPNAIANAAVAKAINQTNANIATNTEAINQANANIATNTAGIATNAASLSALQTQLTAVTAITAVQTGPIDDARLSENVVKTTGSYTNPAWISALDPTRITQNSLHRFVSEAEKEAWNQKPDLAQVKLAIKDSTRTYTFVNAAVTSSGTSTTVTIPSGGGASMPVDTVLSVASPNAIANAAVAKAINQTNANIATNTVDIATNAASLSALQTQLTAVTAITAVQTGPIDDARLSENVVKTTGSYTNPAWISALDPTRITQNSLHRFVSEAEKEAWNQKPDLAQVKLAIKDSTRTYTFVNAAVTSSGTSTTVTIPSGGGTSMPVDTVLNTASPNAIANAAVAKAINQTNANVATNSANIATNAASLSALQTQLTAVTAITAVQTGPIDDARLSENVVKTTGSYTNPAWISALDPTRITQTSLHRFVSEAEKETWNQKPDLAQVKLAIKDSTRTYTFVNAAVTSSGTSTTVTIPAGGGTSMPVDTVLSTASPNAIANAAVAKAINQTNANVATNSAAISQANASIATNTEAINQANANIATNTATINQANASIAANTAATATNTAAINLANTNIATNTIGIATNAASLSALQTQVTAATATLSGPVDDARLSANIVKTTGSYTNPGWISAFDATRITQTSLYRFVTDTEKEAWNNKPDLSQVRLAIKDSVRAITFVNAVVTSNGNSLTVTIPNGGGTGSPTTIDNALSPTSTNPLTNAAITSAFNQVNTNIAANTTALANNTTAVNQANANIANLSTTVAANTAGITSNAASVTTLQTQLSVAMAQVASLSALVSQLQQQIAISSGTFTISTPTLTASISSNSSIVLSWPASTNATSYTLESATNSSFTDNLALLSVLSGTSFTATGLTAGVTYYFRIKASGGSNTSPSGYGTVSATISTVQPTLDPPTNVVATPLTTSTIAISWTAPANATGYSVRYATNSSMTSATSITTSATSTTLTGLSPATSYFIDVSATASGFTQSATSSIATATTNAPVPTLATPTNIVASATSESAIAVSWTGSLNATSYSVRYATNSSMTSATTVTSATNNITLTGLTPVTTYFIDVSASASEFMPSAPSPVVTATTSAITPTLTAPTNVVATPQSTSTIAVSWTASANATGYSVRYATNSSMTSATTVTTNTTSATLMGLSPVTTYFIDVLASASGFISSVPSAVVTATTGATTPTLAAPTNVVATPQSASTIAVSWTASANATSYSIRYALTSSMSSATTITTSTTNATLTGLTPATTYFIDVSASASGFVTSTTSATASARTNDAPVTLAAPDNMVATPQSTSTIAVSWTAPANATGYSIRYATNSSMTSATTVTTTATSTTLTGLRASTTYFIDVSATASGFTSSAPASATARTSDAPVTLATPTNVVASPLSTSAIAISWAASTSATSYSIRYALTSSMSSATTVTSTTNSFTLTELLPGTTYFVDVSASASGFVTSATSATASARTIGILTPPTNVVATALGGSAINVSWTASPNATSYSVRYATNSSMTSATTVTTSTTSTTITGLTTLTTYFVDVSATASGYITSTTSPTASATTTAAFVAERTFRLAFQGATSGVATAGWNQIKPTAAQLTTPNSYTSGMLLTESGVSSTVFVTLESPYTQATASSFIATAGSIYPQTIMQSAWQVSSSNLAGGRYSINGLTPGKYYQLYFLSATTIASNATVSYTINGVVKTINAGFNSGVGGGSEFTPNRALVTYFNVQPDANGRITVSNKYVSGTISPFTTCVIRESSVPL